MTHLKEHIRGFPKHIWTWQSDGRFFHNEFKGHNQLFSINGYFQMEDEEHSLNIFGNAHPSAGVSLNIILMVSIISQI